MAYLILMNNLNELVRYLPIRVARKKINTSLDGKVSDSC